MKNEEKKEHRVEDKDTLEIMPSEKIAIELSDEKGDTVTNFSEIELTNNEDTITSKEKEFSYKKLISFIAIAGISVVVAALFMFKSNMQNLNEFEMVLCKLQNTLYADTYSYSYGVSAYSEEQVEYYFHDVITVQGEKIKGIYDVEDGQKVQYGYIEYDVTETLGMENIITSIYWGSNVPQDLIVKALEYNFSAFYNNEENIIEDIIVDDSSLVIKYNFKDLILYCHNNFDGYNLDNNDLDAINNPHSDYDLREHDVELIFKYDGDYLTEYSYGGGEYISRKVNIIFSNINDENPSLHNHYKEYTDINDALIIRDNY